VRKSAYFIVMVLPSATQSISAPRLSEINLKGTIVVPLIIFARTERVIVSPLTSALVLSKIILLS